jgi:multiple sugar transport system permease protein
VSLTTPIRLPDTPPAIAEPERRWSGRRPRRLALHVVLLALALVWLFPLGWALFTSFRSYDETARLGYVSMPASLTLDNYVRAWNDGLLLLHFANTVLVVVPAVVFVLALAIGLAWALRGLGQRSSIALLIFFTAGSLLPPHVLVTPLFRLYASTGLYDQLAGLILIHVAFQLGFCTFVLASFLRTLPREIFEAARIDGASSIRTLASMVGPLLRPALVALAVLETTWIYNDFLWALTLTQTTSKQPVTTALASLSGEFFTNHNVVAAAAILVALPTLAVFLLLRRQLTRGLTVGAVEE